MPYHKIIRGPSTEQVIDDYDGIEYSLYFAFLKGKKFRGIIPESVRLYLHKGDEYLPKASLLGGPLSWLIFSDDLLGFWWPMIKNDVQVFDAPVYFRNGVKFEGYKIINPIRVIDCLDIERSGVEWEEDGSIHWCKKIYIREDKVGEHHIFKLKDYFPPVIVSDQLAKSLKGQGFKGIAFIKCGVSSSGESVKATNR